MRAAFAAMTLCLALVACTSGPVPSLGASLAPAPGGPSASPAPTPALTPVPRGTSPSPSLNSTRAEALIQATATATDWVTALRARDIPSAWPLLSSASQTAYGSYDQFAADRTAFLDTAKGIVLGPSIDPDPRSLEDWLPSAPGAAADSAFVATVGYPELADTNNGEEVLVVAPDATGTWRIWVVR